MHVNQTHGLPAHEFKRAAGFNLKSGIISKPLAQLMSARAKVGVALDPPTTAPSSLGSIRSYLSKEAIEHRRKSRALSLASPGPQRECAGCGTVFIQSTIFGRALYCSPRCRDDFDAKRKKALGKKRIRCDDGTFRWVNPGEKS